ncbi:hypothetical protein AB0892_20275 [Streptomyces sp. NPDC005409]|uniref:hypothetical protein n=1 Tax=Streptomyces sp. NPDC005409 TaxID=3155342 RepID=UPI003451204A
MHHDDEPVFKRSKWGTNHYYYNPRNPVGRALIVITVLFVGTMLILMANRAGPFAPPPAREPWNAPAYEDSWQPVSPTGTSQGAP